MFNSYHKFVNSPNSMKEPDSLSAVQQIHDKSSMAISNKGEMIHLIQGMVDLRMAEHSKTRN